MSSFLILRARDCALDPRRGSRPVRRAGWGDSFQGGPKRPCPRSGVPEGGAARESKHVLERKERAALADLPDESADAARA